MCLLDTKPFFSFNFNTSQFIHFLLAITDCTICNGTGWLEKIPCIRCNTRGVVSDQLFDNQLRKYQPKNDNRQ